MTTKTLDVVANTELEREVLDWINSKGEDYPNIMLVLKDLAYGGCSSGMVSDLIYTEDAARFYDRHQLAIDKMLYNALQDSCSTPEELFKQWDSSDPLARGDENKTILAWFGFEETAHDLGLRAGFDL